MPLFAMLVPPKLDLWLNRLLPRTWWTSAHRLYAPFHHWMVARRSRSLLPRLFSSGELSVTAGPFRGMKYLPLSGGSALLPKLLGAYEQELHPAFEQVLRRNYQTVIDIGCAEGYYLVGLALRLPQATVHGFDLDPRALDTCRRLAELNEVTARIRLAGRATAETLAPLVGPNSLIVSDCEGAEVELLDPSRIPALLNADMIVELHDRLVPEAASIIKKRFSPSHNITIISTTERDSKSYPLLNSLPPEDQKFALEEFRGGPMEWAVLQTRL